MNAVPISGALLIAPEGIEIPFSAHVYFFVIILLIAPEGIEMKERTDKMFANKPLLIAPEGIEMIQKIIFLKKMANS